MSVQTTEEKAKAVTKEIAKGKKKKGKKKKQSIFEQMKMPVMPHSKWDRDLGE